MKTLRYLLLVCVLAVFGSRATAQTTVSIAATDGAAAERLPGQASNPGNLRLSRTGDTGAALTVWVKVSGVAVQGEDYTFGSTIGNAVVIPAGSASLEVPVTVLDDWLTEGTEDVRIRLDAETASGTPVPYTIGAPDRATVNIADNEDPLAPPRAIVTVAAVDAVAMETAGGSDPAVFRITRANNLAPALTVRIALGGSATMDLDYPAPPAATINIPAGVESVDVTIVPIDDALVEATESLTFTVLPTDIVAVPLPAEAYVLGTATVAGAAIASDDLTPAPAVAITTPGSSAAAPSGRPITVNFTASAVDGYIESYALLVSGNVVDAGTTNLPASTPAGTPYNGTASVTFTGANGFAHLSVRVTNNHGVSATSAIVPVYLYVAPPPPPPPPVLPIINLYPLDADGAEVAAGAPNVASFRVTHSFPATSTVSFLFEMGGTAREEIDYAISSPGAVASGLFGRWFTFPAGTTETQVIVTPLDDLLIENAETVTMSLYTPPFIGFNEGGSNSFEPGTFGFYYGPNHTASVNVLSDDVTPPPFPLLTIAATDPLGSETPDGSDPVSFTITRHSGPTDVPLTVNCALTVPVNTGIYYWVRPPMAANGADFPALSGTATIPAGAVSTEIVVFPIYDLISEPTETLQLTLRPSAVAWPAAGGYVLDEGIVATATIRDLTLAPGTPVVWIHTFDPQAYEDPNTYSRMAVFTVERNTGLASALTVNYTISGTATNGVDYVTLPGTFTFLAGSPRTQITVTPIADGVAEPVESVGITIQPPPLTANPPPYVVGSTRLQQRTAGASIRDGRPPTAQLYINRMRNGHVIVPRPVAAVAVQADALLAPPALWAVEASTDLATWEEIGTVDNLDTLEEFVDINAGDFASRFYRFRPLAAPVP